MTTTSTEVFAFGQSVLPRPPSCTGRRSYYVLGAYPSGLHVRWQPPALPGLSLRGVQAMIVDNEPTPFWDGVDASKRFDEWVDKVGWQAGWGEVQPAGRHFNGPSGGWIGDHILAPLGIGPDEVCISDCLDKSRLNAGQSTRIEDTYKPFAAKMGLPPCSLRLVPAGESGIVAEARDHLARLRSELQKCRPTTVITLGNAALRVMGMLLKSPKPNPGSALRTNSYGEAVTATFAGETLTWLPVVHPRSGTKSPKWRDTHAHWEAAQSGQR
jgi:uracil-DNA glycosylase